MGGRIGSINSRLPHYTDAKDDDPPWWPDLIWPACKACCGTHCVDRFFVLFDLRGVWARIEEAMALCGESSHTDNASHASTYVRLGILACSADRVTAHRKPGRAARTRFRSLDVLCTCAYAYTSVRTYASDRSTPCVCTRLHMRTCAFSSARSLYMRSTTTIMWQRVRTYMWG
jgi:hypothetical protein